MSALNLSVERGSGQGVTVDRERRALVLGLPSKSLRGASGQLRQGRGALLAQRVGATTG